MKKEWQMQLNQQQLLIENDDTHLWYCKKVQDFKNVKIGPFCYIGPKVQLAKC